MKQRLNTAFDAELAIDWLNNSGIQDAEGGFYAWYDIDKEDYSFLYPEITGYAIQILSRLHTQTGEKGYLANAAKAGDWLLHNQNSDGSFMCKYFNSTTKEKNDTSFYVFDAGIIVCGLLELHRITSKNKYLSAATKSLDLMLEFQNPDGSFYAGRTPDGDIINMPHWSRTSSCHHIKMMLPLLRLHNITEEPKYLEASQKLLEWSSKLQLPTGRFATFHGSNNTYTHAHCYAIEGLVAASKYFGDSKEGVINKQVNLGVDWLLKFQNTDGSIWNWNGAHEDKIKVCEALAQTIRLFILTKREANPGDTRVNKGFGFLKKMQFLDEKRHTHGGISYGEAQGKPIGNVSTCATVFAIHAALLSEKEPHTQQLFEEMI